MELYTAISENWAFLKSVELLLITNSYKNY